MTSKGGSRSDSPLAAPISPTLKIRAANEADRDFIRRLSLRVFSQFGDYATFLPTYLDEPAILTTVAEEVDTPRGFLMLAFVLADPDEPGTVEAEAAHELIAEILAIAVAPRQHRAGIGKQLMQHALEFVEECAASSRLSSLQLNVAHTNTQAMAFFERMGFIVLNQDDGTYPAGQRSIRMIHPVHSR